MAAAEWALTMHKECVTCVHHGATMTVHRKRRPRRPDAASLARISHTRCCLRRFKEPTGQEPCAVRCGASDKRGDAPCRLLQPALRVAFRRASPASGGSTVWPDTLSPRRCRICLAERATQAAWSVRNAGSPGGAAAAPSAAEITAPQFLHCLRPHAAVLYPDR